MFLASWLKIVQYGGVIGGGAGRGVGQSAPSDICHEEISADLQAEKRGKEKRENG